LNPRPRPTNFLGLPALHVRCALLGIILGTETGELLLFGLCFYGHPVSQTLIHLRSFMYIPVGNSGFVAKGCFSDKLKFLQAGGFRKGAGRKPLAEGIESVTCSTKLHTPLAKWIAKESKRRGITRSAMIRLCVAEKANRS